jgi:spermidine/putrescine transport system permease protein
MRKDSILIPGPQGHINLWTRLQIFFRRHLPTLAAYPYVLWMALFAVIPIIMIVIYAFTTAQGSFTLDNFSNMADYAKVFGRSMLLALIATAVCLVIGYPVAYTLSKAKPNTQRILMLLIMLPMWINFLLRTYAWMSLLENTGLINRFFAAVGIIDLGNLVNSALNSGCAWLNGLFGWSASDGGWALNVARDTEMTYFRMINTSGAVVLGMVYNYLPFMILPIHSVISKIDRGVIEAAQDLGANSRTVFRKVIFPLSIPGVISGITMVFVPSVSTFVISRLLGGSTTLLLGDLIEMQFMGTAYNPHLGAAISLIMMVIVVICMSIMNKFGEGEEQAVML